MYQTGKVFIYNTCYSNSRSKGTSSVSLTILHAYLSEAVFPDSAKRDKGAAHLTMSRPVNNSFTLESFYFQKNALRELFQEKMYSSKRKRQKHPVFLCSSAVLSANTNIIYFQRCIFLILHSAFWGYIRRVSLVSKSPIHVGDMNLDSCSFSFMLGKAIVKSFIYLAIHIPSKEEDMINHFFSFSGIRDNPMTFWMFEWSELEIIYKSACYYLRRDNKMLLPCLCFVMFETSFETHLKTSVDLSLMLQESSCTLHLNLMYNAGWEILDLQVLWGHPVCLWFFCLFVLWNQVLVKWSSLLLDYGNKGFCTKRDCHKNEGLYQPLDMSTHLLMCLF